VIEQHTPLNSKKALNDRGEHDKQSLNEMLQELRILQQGSQILTGFLILLPFNEGFSKIAQLEKLVYIVAFISSVVSLICFSAPAAQHRLKRPLKHRGRFKRLSTRIIIAGMVGLSIALIATTQMVLNEVIGQRWSLFATVLVGVLISVIWWIFPLYQKGQE
jgi:accessory gene regulator protein AgrB